ncbi:hypothetical protein WUBG_11329 [Wuchereria bancrofti]|uniref:Uncharacterized protein n=1 Tax=Wuchereria bancrofti TaxID=6293 RepID=J9ER52_WUCBA|nr:hypothetical protein WUBG_11329 [Wuchereria bancrofti]
MRCIFGSFQIPVTKPIDVRTKFYNAEINVRVILFSPNNPVCNQLVVYGDDALVFDIDKLGVRLIKVESFSRLWDYFSGIVTDYSLGCLLTLKVTALLSLTSEKYE